MLCMVNFWNSEQVGMQLHAFYWGNGGFLLRLSHTMKLFDSKVEQLNPMLNAMIELTVFI